jgi:hypothetical protein
MFNLLLDRNPTTTEIEKYANIGDDKQQISNRIMTDYSGNTAQEPSQKAPQSQPMQESQLKNIVNQLKQVTSSLEKMTSL